MRKAKCAVWHGGAYGAMIIVVLVLVAILAPWGELVPHSLLESWWMRGIVILCTFWMLVATWTGRIA